MDFRFIFASFLTRIKFFLIVALMKGYGVMLYAFFDFLFNLDFD